MTSERDQRNERLSLLRDRTEEYADNEIERIENETAFLESVLDGRSPGGQLEDHIRTFASSLAQDEIDEFLGV